jgi:hypothetical protein
MHRSADSQLHMSANLLDLFTVHPGARELAAIESAFRPERRKRPRTQVHWRVLLLRDGQADAIETVTQNLSSMGFYCLAETALTPGEYLGCVLTIPSHDPSGYERARVLECRVRVTRVEPEKGEKAFGIACQIQDYHLVAEDRRDHTRHEH